MTFMPQLAAVLATVTLSLHIITMSIGDGRSNSQRSSQMTLTAPTASPAQDSPDTLNLQNRNYNWPGAGSHASTHQF